MKRLLVMLLLAGVSLHLHAARRALLIGVGNYPPKSGWRVISSDNDISLLKRGLFRFPNVATLNDKEATHHNIIEAINRLISQTHPGDTVFIHFSCHGQQMLTNDKDEPDHLDEALVSYDAPSKESRAYRGQNHLRDNELGKLIGLLRKKAGKTGLAVITIDACFSDSMDKGEGKDDGVVYRGGADIFGANTIGADSLLAIRRLHMRADNDTLGIMPDGANVIVISACKTYQKSVEVVKDGKGYGPLSYAMYASAKHSGQHDLYKWLDGIYRQMQKDAFTQTPQIRTTLSYRFPTKPTQEPSGNTFPTTAVAVAALLSITLSCLIWKRERKR